MLKEAMGRPSQASRRDANRLFTILRGLKTKPAIRKSLRDCAMEGAEKVQWTAKSEVRWADWSGGMVKPIVLPA